MASLTRITAATGGVVSLVELMEHLNFHEPGKDATIAGYLLAAQDWVAEAIGRPLLNEVWEYRIDGFPVDWRWANRIRIPLPASSVTEIGWVDSEGVSQVVVTGSPASTAPLGYLLVDNALVTAYGQNWPTTRREAGAVRVQFISGFGTSPGHVPEPVRAAIRLLAGRFFAQRESILEQGWFESALVDQLLRPYRWRLVEAV